MHFPGAASLLMIRGREVSISPCSYLIPPLQMSSPLEEGRSSESALRGEVQRLRSVSIYIIIYITRAREDSHPPLLPFLSYGWQRWDGPERPT